MDNHTVKVLSSIGVICASKYTLSPSVTLMVLPLPNGLTNWGAWKIRLCAPQYNSEYFNQSKSSGGKVFKVVANISMEKGLKAFFSKNIPEHWLF